MSIRALRNRRLAFNLLIVFEIRFLLVLVKALALLGEGD